MCLTALSESDLVTNGYIETIVNMYAFSPIQRHILQFLKVIAKYQCHM